MEQINQTTSQRFILLGLSNVPHLQVISFVILLVTYLMTISGNLLLIITVRINPRLHSPMYFFLTTLSIIDTFFSSSFAPVLLKNTLAKDRSISLLGCAAQLFFSIILGDTECILLAVMAYDRFVAICRPLHYTTIMNKMLCLYLIVGSWSVGIIDSFVQVNLLFQLPFCNYLDINHYFCEAPALIQLSCGDTFLNELYMYITGSIIAACSFFLVLISYVHIISSILKITSSQGRQKTFSTCASHLTVVTLYYGTIMVIYLQPQPKKFTSNQTDKVLPLIYTVVTPMLNPIIYSIRNKDVKNTIITQLKRKKSHYN
ncbi:olfactory receptor 10A3-like [Leptodactylus fuscus]|uniref:olfactory receptor 10A3-like n=1 Tax=Leptodactylus fuscus TaxID=238119 RepID=UPI003F4EF7AD